MDMFERTRKIIDDEKINKLKEAKKGTIEEVIN